MDRHAVASAAEARAEEQRQRGLPKSNNNNNGLQGANNSNNSNAVEASRVAGDTTVDPPTTGGSGKAVPEAVTSGVGVTGTGGGNPAAARRDNIGAGMDVVDITSMARNLT